jgi:hypothetical protein
LATTSSEERENNKHNQKFIPSILTKVVKESKGDGCSGENCDENVVGGDIESSSSPWPQIVQESILFGISAYNPRGQETPLETNQTQQALLQKDIQRAIAEYYYRCPIGSTSTSTATYWNAIGIWEDGSFEPGFILAFPREMENQGMALSTTLARNYNQGAIYKFWLDEISSSSSSTRKMMRDTIAVLEEGCDARVEVEIDNTNSDNIDLLGLVQQFTS